MREILQYLAEIFKAIGSEAMLELAKSKWVKFSIGVAILLLASLPFLPEIIRAIQGR